MRALLISLNGVEEVELGLKHLQALSLIDGRSIPEKDNVILQSMYAHMDCDTVTGAGYPDQAHACWADDNGLFFVEDGTQVTITSWWPEKLVGKLLVTGFNPKNGATTPATLSVEELLSMVKIGVIRKQ